MSKRGLIIGINDYKISPLSGCIPDAYTVAEVLSRNEDGSPNFEIQILTSDKGEIRRNLIADSVRHLFEGEADTALFYFSGHGAITDLGGYLISQEAERIEDGFSMRDLLEMANNSKIREILILLDCCHSGSFGELTAAMPEMSLLRPGMALLAASHRNQVAMESGGQGVFTRLLTDALTGGAADVLGRITAGSVYGYIDQALGAWEQRPIFKAHLVKMLTLRKCEPQVDVSILRLLPNYFENPDEQFPLDPSYEPDSGVPDEQNVATFAHLQTLRDAHLLKSINTRHLYHAAMNSESCELTPLGKYYWHLAKKGQL